MAEPTRTPTKLSKSLNLSPKSINGICIICGLFIDTTYRRKLYIGSKKTEICLLIEKVLNISILRECSSHTACRKCVTNVTKTDSLLTLLLSSYKATTSQLYGTHGRDVTKRLRPVEESSSKESRRKTLFQDSGPELCEPLNQTSTVTSTREPDGLRVTVCLQDGVTRSVLDNLGPIASALTTSDYKYLSEVIFQCPDLQKYLIENTCHLIQTEISELCAKHNKSLLRQTDSESLLHLSFEDISNELKQKTPTFWTILQVFTSNPSLQRNKRKNNETLLPAIVTSASKLISAYNRDLNALQHLNSILLSKGGAKKSLFQRFSATGDCCAYNASTNDIENFSKDWNKDVLDWKTQCEKDHLQEKALLHNIHILKETAEIDASPDIVLLLDEAAKTLQRHQTGMHPGFYFVGDNVDFYTKVRHMTSMNQNKSQHMFQICAYMNRVSGNHLDNLHPKNDPDKVNFSEFIPSPSDQSAVRKELTLLVAWKWTEFIPSLFSFSSVLPDFICHRYMKEMKVKSSRRNLGVLERNEQYNAEMIDICQFIHQFVPNHDLDDSSKVPLKTLSGGDYLTFERHKRAQQCRENGRTPSKSLQGLIPKMEEFHNQAEFLKVIWSQLFKSESFQCIGTLSAAKNRINATNVPADPHNDYYASSEFMDKVTAAYIIAGGLHHFKMENLDSQPTPEYDGPIGDKKSMHEYIMGHAMAFVDEHVDTLVPTLPDFGPQSNTLACRYCNKVYARPKSLRKHEARVHQHPDPVHNPDGMTSSTKAPQKGTVYDYTKLCLTLGLFRLNHNDAIKMGDGERMMRIAKYFCLYYKACKCPKYAFGMLETTAQAQVLLSERQAERLVWNRTVNHQGKPDTNHPNDLDIEHCNKVFKEQVHTYRGKYTEKTILRVSRSALTTDRICKHFDRLANVRHNAGKHTKGDFSEDILCLVDQLHKRGNVYIQDDRSNEHFSNLQNPLDTLDMETVQFWISESLKTFRRRLFYEI